ncbi:OB-fold domain-containing protein [Candidatus Roizmanbacteria bacterium]|nr:OB-fold domain-containing protein [Candidatus Roizmanbacteria bacterium]
MTKVEDMISPVKIWRRQKEIRGLLSKTGSIITWTLIYVSGKDFKKYAPFPVVMVEFENGKKAVGQLVDYSKEDLKIGGKVISVLRKVRESKAEDVIPYGLKFRPLI